MMEAPNANRQDARLQRKLSAARAAMFWERLWRAALAPVCVAGLFLALSWFGLWTQLPRQARAAGVIIAGLVFLYACRGLLKLRMPAAVEARARLDSDSGIAHRPVTATLDRQAAGISDPFASLLWKRHQERASQAAADAPVTLPRPRVARQDLYAFRAAVLFAAIAGFFVAGPERSGRLEAAFAWSEPPPPPVPTRIDAWVDPPSYTGRPPIFLTRENRDTSGRIGVPVNSTLVVRISPAAGVVITADAGLIPVEPAAGAALPADVVERRFAVKADGGARAEKAAKALADFSFTAILDKPPVIEIVGEPERADGERLSIRYKAEDDYGIVLAEARFEKITAAGQRPRRSLIDPPNVALQIPHRSDGPVEGETLVELTEHGWAGARVNLHLFARDEAGQESKSQTVEVVIPQKVFTEPLAKALVEQRRKLIIDPDRRDLVQIALDALLTAPEIFTPNAGTFIALRTASTRLRSARTDPELLDLADWLWKIALELEDGGLSDAERALRQAQERLTDALERNAPPEEIARLTDQLRRAMDQYMREMAERARRNPETQQADRNDPNQRFLTQRDLQSMLDKIEELSRQGKNEEARRLLEQLNRMMENMRTARQQRQMDPRQREMGESLDELDKLTREQQQLRDRTFQRNQRNRNAQRGQQQQGQRGQQGQQGEEGDQGEGDEDGDGDQQGEGNQQGQGSQPRQGGQQGMRDRQQALRNQLNQLRQRMQRGGLGNQQGLDDAGEAMGDAEGQLGQGQNGQALGSQDRALQGLRRGAQDLAQQMMQEGGDGTEMGEGDEGFGPGDPRNANPRNRARPDQRFGRNRDRQDPLGRERWNNGRVDDGGRMREGQGLSRSERAREILEELRRRLGDQSRPTLELDYLERLLRRDP